MKKQIIAPVFAIGDHCTTKMVRSIKVVAFSEKNRKGAIDAICDLANKKGNNVTSETTKNA